MLKRGLAAPLLFLALAFASWGSLDASPAIWLGAIVLLLAAAWLLPAASRGLTVLSAAAGGFALWLVVTNWAFNPSYSAAAPYHAAFLLGGLIVGRRAGLTDARQLFASSLSMVLCLAAWALCQEAVNPAQRAHALFETPATLAASINLLLLPSVTLILFGNRQLLLLTTVVALSAGLIAAGSLGGWLAAALGSALAIALAYRGGLRLQRRPLALASLAVLLGWAIALWLPYLWSALPSFGGTAGPAAAAQSAPIPPHQPIESSAARLDLYELALRSLSLSFWLTGYGYLGFYYLMEAARDAIRTYGASTTFFVHNDYLQVLLELGAPGLAMFLALVLLPFVVAWRAVPAAREGDDRLTIIAAVASISTMTIHAFVDFPFYIPVCVMIYGLAIGVLDARASRLGAPPGRRVPRAVTVGVATLAVWILATPVAAEAAAAYAQRQWRAREAQSAAYWFEMARRIEPRDWRYHWYAGQFWYFFAAENNKGEAAQFADRAFAAGFAANPREARNLLGRILVHRNLRPLLAAPADAATVMAWANRAVELAPFSAGARAEREMVTRQFGKR